MMRGDAAIALDYVTSEWKREHFIAVLVNGCHVEEDRATLLVDNEIMLSGSGDLKRFASRFFWQYLPWMLEMTPAAPFGAAIQIADKVIDSIEAKFAKPSYEALPELEALGAVLKKLGKRAMLQEYEKEFEGGSAAAIDVTQMGADDVSKLTQAAMIKATEAIPQVAKALLRLAAAQHAGGEHASLTYSHVPMLSAETGDAFAGVPRPEAMVRSKSTVAAVGAKTAGLKARAAPTLNSVASTVVGAPTHGMDAIHTLAHQPLPGPAIPPHIVTEATKRNFRGPAEFVDWLKSVEQIILEPRASY